MFSYIADNSDLIKFYRNISKYVVTVGLKPQSVDAGETVTSIFWCYMLEQQMWLDRQKTDH